MTAFIIVCLIILFILARYCLHLQNKLKRKEIKLMEEKDKEKYADYLSYALNFLYNIENDPQANYVFEEKYKKIGRNRIITRTLISGEYNIDVFDLWCKREVNNLKHLVKKIYGIRRIDIDNYVKKYSEKQTENVELVAMFSQAFYIYAVQYHKYINNASFTIRVEYLSGAKTKTMAEWTGEFENWVIEKQKCTDTIG